MAIIIKYLSTVYGIVETMALIASILLLRKDGSNKWRAFIGYLFIMVGIEVLGTYSMLNKLALLNHSLYNFLLLVQIIFFIPLIFSFLELKRKKHVKVVLFILLFISFFTELYLKHFEAYNNYTKFFLCFIITIMCCLFFYRLMLQQPINLLNYPAFWAVVGLFFYAFVSAILFAFNNMIVKAKLTDHEYVYRAVMYTLSVILYFSWIYSFICRKKQIKSQS